MAGAGPRPHVGIVMEKRPCEKPLSPFKGKESQAWALVGSAEKGFLHYGVIQKGWGVAEYVPAHPGWTPYPVQLNSEPLAANKPSSLDSDLPLESLIDLTPPEEPGSFVYLDSSVPTKMLSPPQRFAGQLSPQLDKVAAPHQGLAWQERLQKLLLMVDGGQNQFLALPPHLKRKIQTSGLHHTADHQAGEVPFVPLDRQQSKAAKFLSHLNKEEEQDQHQQLPEVVVGTPHQLEKPKFQEQISQEKDIYTSMDGGEHDSHDLESQENTDQPPEAPGQTTPSQFQLEAQNLHPETPQSQPDLAAEEGVEQLLVPQEVKAPSLGRREEHHSQELVVTVNVLVKNMRTTPAGKEAQPPPLHQQAPASLSESPEGVKPSPTQQEAPSQPPGSPMETELSPSQQDQPLLTSETAEEVETSGSQLEALPETENPLEEVKSPVQEDTPALETTLGRLGDEVRISTPAHHQAKHSHWLRLTVNPPDLLLTKRPEPTAEVRTSQTHHEVPAQVSVLLDDVELPVTLIEALTLPPEPSEGAEFFKFQWEVLFPSSESIQDEQGSPSPQESMDGSLQASEESEASSTQWEATVEHLQTSKEVEPSSTPEGAGSQPPELPHEITAQALGHHKAAVSSPT
ncbi:leucine-rich repeat-containing protein 37A3-like, partial [Heterocephalus glaber]|uniref:Leucine-rich repeat-containing protein 37A3-like n=1 Tax=Heterocephalus glaber TaxID=10181 RepID=A0AAX6TFJ2_HETGA